MECFVLGERKNRAATVAVLDLKNWMQWKWYYENRVALTFFGNTFVGKKQNLFLDLHLSTEISWNFRWSRYTSHKNVSGQWLNLGQMISAILTYLAVETSLYAFYFWHRRGGGSPPSLKNFRASVTCSIILNVESIFNAMKNFRAHSVFQGKRKVAQKSWMAKNIFNTVKIFRANSVFQGKRKLLKNPKRWKNVQCSGFSWGWSV